MTRISLPALIGAGYKDFWNTKARYRVCKGGRGSKKSKTTALNRIYRLLKYPLSNYLCVRRYSNTLRDSVYADTLWAINQFGLEDYFHAKQNPMEIIYIPTGQKIIFRGLDNGLKITSISVSYGHLNFVDIEEAYEINEDDFNKLDMSIRGELPDGYFKQITLIFNPWSANSWLKSRFFDIEDETIFTKTTTYRCNEWLDDSDRNIFDLMAKTNPRRYNIEANGNWGISEGLIFENAVQEDFDIGAIRCKEGMLSAFGLDFGFTDPNAFVALCVDNKEKIIYVFDEWYKTGVTNKNIANAIKKLGYGGQRIICDSAEPKSIEELRQEGLKAEGSRKGRDSVNHGIQQIQNYKIIVHPKCVEFWREVQNYCYEKDRNGRLTDKPDHEFSHCMDALRYATANILLGDVYSWE